MRVLFIGGTGIISTGTVARLLELGHDVAILTRGRSSSRPAPDGVRQLVGDATQPASVAAAIGDEQFDAVLNFRAFTPADVATDVELFRGRTGQYIFISSASVYTKPLLSWPIREDAPVGNPLWDYAQAKADGEDVLHRAREDFGFPATIVRPSHTYDHTGIPIPGGWTAIDRMRRGLPVPILGDGTSLWTLTHTRDFGVGLAGLVGNPAAVGETFHITSERALTWDTITDLLADAAGVTARKVYVPSTVLAEELPEMGPGLLADKAHSLLFDNTKVRSLVPEFNPQIGYDQGAREAIAFIDRHSHLQRVDAEVNAGFDRAIARLTGPAS